MLGDESSYAADLIIACCCAQLQIKSLWGQSGDMVATINQSKGSKQFDTQTGLVMSIIRL